jgi:hypothetical protein
MAARIRALWAVALGLVAFGYVNLARLGELAPFARVQYDDAYITYRYSANLVLGHGLTFNPGDLTNSASSFLWTVLLVPLYWFTGADLPAAVCWVGMVAHAATASIVVLYGLSRRSDRLGLAVAVAAGTVFAVNPLATYWALSGMETPLFLLLLAAAIWASRSFVKRSECRGASASAGWSTGLVLALLSLVRWEGAAVAGALGVLCAVSVIADPTTRARQQWRQAVPVILIPVAATTALVGFNAAYYGSIVPDPVAFKRVFSYYVRSPADSVAAIGHLFVEWVPLAVGVLALVGLALTVRRSISIRREVGVNADLAAALAGAVLLAFVILSAHSDFNRYELPLLVAALLLAMHVVPSTEPVEVPARVGALMPSAVRWIVVAMAALVFALSIGGELRGLGRVVLATSDYLYVQSARESIGRQLETSTADGTVVLSGDLGALSFYNISNRYIDAYGLANRTLIEELKAGRPYSSIIVGAHPEVVADTAMADLVPVSEKVFDQPSDFFDSRALPVISECRFAEAFADRAMLQEPAAGGRPLYVVARSLTPLRTCTGPGLRGLTGGGPTRATVSAGVEIGR